MFRIAIGHSDELFTNEATQTCISQIRSQLHGRSPKALLVYSALGFSHQEMLTILTQEFPQIPLIGCTTDGEMSSVMKFQEDSLTVAAFDSDGVEFVAGIGRNLSKDVVAASQTAVQQALQQSTQEPKLCITTPESLTASGVAIVDSLRAKLGKYFPIVGGIAGDQWKFTGSYQFFANEVLQDSLPILLLTGPIDFSIGVSSGWIPVGDHSVVTKATHNTVFEIGGKPALAYYQRYFGPEVKPPGELPLAVYSEDDDNYYLRAPIAYDKDQGSITFAGDLPEGSKVRLTQAHRDGILAATNIALQMALDNFPTQSQPDAALVFGCAGRKQLLGTRTVEESQILLDHLPEKLPMVGFYTYGEIAPVALGKPTRFHNNTLIVVLLGSRL